MLKNPDRPILTDEEFNKLSKEEIKVKWNQLQNYIDTLEEANKENLYELAKLKNIILMNYISSKELESTFQFKESNIPSNATPSHNNNNSTTNNNSSTNNQSNKTKQTFVDPLVNSIIIELKKELDETRRKRDELQIELNSTKFTQESQINKKLIAKCRKLLEENEELGKVISSGNVAQLEHDLAYHKQLINEAAENEQNINSFLLEIDNQMNAMHTSILSLQQNASNNKNSEKPIENKPNNSDNNKSSKETSESKNSKLDSGPLIVERMEEN